MQDVIAARHVVHHIEHKLLQQAAQRARAGPFADRLRGQFSERILRKLQLHPFHGQQLGILPRQRVSGFRQN